MLQGTRCPREIWSCIFSYLELRDLLHVNLTCRLFKEISDRYIYATITVKWSEIAQLASDSDYRNQYMKKLCIVNSDVPVSTSGEWNTSPLLPLISSSRWHELTAQVCSRSTSWLKYLSSPMEFVYTLRLTAESLGPRSPHLFDFVHIGASFPNVRTLSLSGFGIEASIDEGDHQDSRYPLKSLVELEVRECTWDFPMRINAISPNMEVLKISVTDPSIAAFLLSERLKYDTTHISPKLRTFILQVNSQFARSVNWRPLSNGSSTLEYIELSGLPPQSPTWLSKFPKLKSFIENSVRIS